MTHEEMKMIVAHGPLPEWIDLGIRRDLAFDGLEQLRASVSPVFDAELQDDIIREEARWLDLVVACMAWAGTPPAVPGFLN